MMQRRFIKNSAFFSCILLLAFFQLSFCYADDCSMGRTPDGVYPVNQADIIMVSEDILVQVEKRLVSCEFKFQNNGEEKDILMGFPKTPDVSKLLEDNAEESKYIEEKASINDFMTFVDGVKIPVKIEKNIKNSSATFFNVDYKDWFVFSIHFGKNESKIVKNTYSMNYTYYSNGDVIVGYILKTGAYWKDKIGHAKVSFDMGKIKPYEVLELKPVGYRYEENNIIVWEADNLEPTEDLIIRYNNRLNDEDYIKNFEGQEKENLIKTKQEKEKAIIEVKSADLTVLYKYLEMAKSDHEDGMVLYIGERIKKLGGSVNLDIENKVETTKTSEVINTQTTENKDIEAMSKVKDEKTNDIAVDTKVSSKDIDSDENNSVKVQKNTYMSIKNNGIIIGVVSGLILLILFAVIVKFKSSKRN